VPAEPESAMASTHSNDQPLYTPPNSPGSSISDYAEPCRYTRPAQSADGHLVPQYGMAPRRYGSGPQQIAYSIHDGRYLASPGQYGVRSPVYSTPPLSPGTNWYQTDYNTAPAPFSNPNPSSSVDSYYAQ